MRDSPVLPFSAQAPAYDTHYKTHKERKEGRKEGRNKQTPRHALVMVDMTAFSWIAKPAHTYRRKHMVALTHTHTHACTHACAHTTHTHT